MERAQEMMVIKSLINDSLMARSDKQLTSEIINEIASELMSRFGEIWDEKSKEVECA